MKFKNYLVLIIGVFGIWLLPFCGDEDDEDTSMEETEEQCEQWTAERQSQCMINGTYDSANCECDCDEGFSGELCQDEDVEEEPCEITEESVDTCNVNGIFDDDLCECVCELGWS
ncbi:MAG: hypothetical protein KJO29_09755, partial [Bacteroidia bacterium]|nr:hypothetical protein [Bacteroidia bacterium]